MTLTWLDIGLMSDIDTRTPYPGPRNKYQS